MLKDSDIVHELLFHALIDIRGQGVEMKDKVVFHLADLFHNIVLEMGQATSDNADYSRILTKIRKRAEAKGCERWIDSKMKIITETKGQQ